MSTLRSGFCSFARGGTAAPQPPNAGEKKNSAAASLLGFPPPPFALMPSSPPVVGWLGMEGRPPAPCRKPPPHNPHSQAKDSSTIPSSSFFRREKIRANLFFFPSLSVGSSKSFALKDHPGVGEEKCHVSRKTPSRNPPITTCSTGVQERTLPSKRKGKMYLISSSSSWGK